MRFRLRTLLVALTIGPPVVAWSWYAWQIKEAMASLAAGIGIAVTAAAVLGVLTAGVMLLCFKEANR